MFWCFPLSLGRPLVCVIRWGWAICYVPWNWNYMSSTHFKTMRDKLCSWSHWMLFSCFICFPDLLTINIMFHGFACQSPKPQGSLKPWYALIILTFDMFTQHLTASANATWNARSSTCCRVSHCRSPFSAVRILREYTWYRCVQCLTQSIPESNWHPEARSKCLRRCCKCEFHSKSNFAWNFDVHGTTRNRAFGELAKSLFLRSKALARSTGAAQKRMAQRTLCRLFVSNFFLYVVCYTFSPQTR